MYILGEVKARLEAMGISPKKSLGQNFLINGESIERIVKAASQVPCASIIEVGPGLGALTEKLHSLGHPIVLMELDKTFSAWWRDRGFTLIEGDALRLDWRNLGAPSPILLVSNLPYQISASLVIDRSIDPCGVEAMILMFQKEVAQRIMARKGSDDYGMLSVIGQTYWSVEKLFEISSKDFWPPPQVASRVLKFRRREFSGDDSFLKFVKAAFAQRRKFLIKNLSVVEDVEVLRGLFEKQGIDPKARAEDLTPGDFQQLYFAWKES